MVRESTSQFWVRLAWNRPGLIIVAEPEFKSGSNMDTGRDLSPPDMGRGLSLSDKGLSQKKAINR